MAPIKGRVARPEQRWGCCRSTPGNEREREREREERNDS